MQNGVNIATSETELNVIYGLMDLRKERELARASVKYILTDLNDIRVNYFRLGFHLYECSTQKFYEDFGFATMEEFCDKNFGLDKSSVSRCINVFLAFCSRSGSLPQMFLSERWSEYSYSQLTEMLPMSEEQRRLVKPEMTIKQIRELKKSFKKSKKNSVATSQQEVKYSHAYCSGISGAVRNQYYKKVVGHLIDIDVVDSNGKPVDNLYNIKADLLYDESDHIVIRLHTCKE